MSLAAKLLEDQAFVAQFLAKSHCCLLESRLLAEDLLTNGNITYYREGYVIVPSGFTPDVSLTNRPGTPACFSGWISAHIFPSLSATAMLGQHKDCCQSVS
jgi:hypothetical protein